MKIFSLYIEKYMKFEKQEIKFNSENISRSKEDFQKELFGKMNITLFCGLNGTGKTSVLSFIAKIFRYLQRFRERIPSDFKIHYSIKKENKEYDKADILRDKISNLGFVVIDEKQGSRIERKENWLQKN